MYVERILEKELLRHLPQKEIMAVVGPRQCGKTTLLQHIFSELSKALFLTFEDRQVLELFEMDLSAFIDLYVKGNDYLFIDEFQYAKDGGKNLKFIYDTHSIKIIVSGSSASGLSIHGLKYLVGRVFVFNLYPFSFSEFLKYRDEKLWRVAHGERLSRQVIPRVLPYFQEYCVYGGYPRVVLSDTSEEKELVLKNIYNTYFLKEVKEILNIQQDHKLSKLMKALALQIGSLVNYQELAQISGFTNKEVVNYLHILEKTFVSFLARPFYTNRRTEMVKAPKVFFFDHGFRNVVIRDFQPLAGRTDKGSIYENFVAVELLTAGEEVRYWRTKSKAEVDFVVGNVPIEVKSSLSEPSLTRSFASFLDKYKSDRGLMLSESLFANRKMILFRPLFYLAFNRKIYK